MAITSMGTITRGVAATWFLALAVGLISGASAQTIGDSEAPHNGRTPALDEGAPFRTEIMAFLTEDATAGPEHCGTLFIGSSSIRLWSTLADDFPERRVVNRGFGGSELEHAVTYFDLIVAPYHPKEIVLYAGENDIHAGKSPETVLSDLRAFIDLKTASLGGTPVYYISIKPSKARAGEFEHQSEANALIADEAAQRSDLVYVDVVSTMMEDGIPKDIFVDDDLHMNREGYGLWRKVVAAALKDSAASVSPRCTDRDE